MKMPMMKCGCRANSYHRKPDGTEEPACVVHAPDPAAYTPIPEPDLSQRRARCAYYKTTCGQERPSTDHLAFFVHKPDQPFDEFYCGCHGWD